MKNRYLILPALIFAIALFVIPTGRVKSVECTAIPQGTALDWGEIDSDLELESCLIILAKALKTPQAMAEWLKAQGFVKVSVYDGMSETKTMVGAFWILDQHLSFKPHSTLANRAHTLAFIFFMSLVPRPILPFRLSDMPYRFTISYLWNGEVEADVGKSWL